MSTPTWKNVGANISSPVRDLAYANEVQNQGMNQIRSGIREASTTNQRAELHNSLLNNAMNPDIGEKEFMASALVLGKDSGLTPEQSFAEIERVQGIFDRINDFTTTQKDTVSNMRENMQLTLQEMQQGADSALAQFDAANPQASTIINDMTQFNQKGGLGTAIQEILADVEHGDDASKTADVINRVAEESQANPYAVAEALRRTKLAEPNLIWDSTLINSKKFRNRVDAVQGDINNWMEAARVRSQQQNALNSAIAERQRNMSDQIVDFEESLREENRNVFRQYLNK